MKTSKILTLILAFVACVAITSCVQDDDYTIPNSLGDEENAGLVQIMNEITDETLTVITIEDLKALYVGTTTQIVSDIVVKGYVSSSDQTGNFYKEFYMQDAPENPTAAMGVVIDQVDTYNQFNKGREIYIRLNGLYLGENSSDVVTIGGSIDGGNVENMNTNQIRTHVFRSQTTTTLVPILLTSTTVNDSHLGMFAQFVNMQFPLSVQGETFVNPTDSFDTRHSLVNCEDESEFLLETSSFASFKQVPLPVEGKGSISGIITQGFGGSPKVMVLNTPSDIDFSDTERCDPFNLNDFTAIFEDDFESMATGSTINGNGWTAYAEAGGFNWRALSTTDSGNPGPGNVIASMGAYNSGDNSNIAWLISPSIDLDAQSEEFAYFQSSNSFSDGSELELLISTDWDGTTANVTTATWTSLPGTIVSDSTYYQDWVPTDLIDLSSYTGTAYIAFKYVGGDDGSDNIDGTFEIDNFKVLMPN